MTTKIAINGFGRIGRLILRIAQERNLDIVAINDLAEPGLIAHLFKYDSVHGTFAAEVGHEANTLFVNGQPIRLFQEPDPGKLPWKELGVDLVFECTGRFRSQADAGKHVKAGAKKVVISAPGKDDVDFEVVMGVNHHLYQPAIHHVLSNASCTTNCLAPLAKVLHDQFGIRRGFMTTIHSYTNDQVVLDFAHKDYRRARAAAQNMIPTTTGAAKAVAKVIPELKGKLNGFAMRVPTPNVSAVDFVVELEKQVSIEQVHLAFQQAATGALQGILAYSEEPLVSSDYNGATASAIIDALSTMILDGNLLKVVAWYDNEYAYATRLVDLVEYMLNKGL